MGLPETLLDALQGGDPKSPALLCSGGAELSRSQLKEQCVILAEAIRNAGIKPGDAVSISETNTVSPMPFIITMICQLKQVLLQICTTCISPLKTIAMLQVEFVIAFIGVTLARAVAAPLNPNYTAVSVKYLSLKPLLVLNIHSQESRVCLN